MGHPANYSACVGNASIGFPGAYPSVLGALPSRHADADLAARSFPSSPAPTWPGPHPRAGGQTAAAGRQSQPGRTAAGALTFARWGALSAGKASILMADYEPRRMVRCPQDHAVVLDARATNELRGCPICGTHRVFAGWCWGTAAGLADPGRGKAQPFTPIPANGKCHPEIVPPPPMLVPHARSRRRSSRFDQAIAAPAFGDGPQQAVLDLVEGEPLGRGSVQPAALEVAGHQRPEDPPVQAGCAPFREPASLMVVLNWSQCVVEPWSLRRANPPFGAVAASMPRSAPAAQI